jgi:two-component system OmpR family sensor kinase
MATRRVLPAMSLRSRLLLALAVLLAVALLVAGGLVVGLTRANLVARVDSELLGVAAGSSRVQRLADLTGTDQDAGRRLAVMRLDRQGNVVRSFPSGFANRPDPLPKLPSYPGGIPRDAFGTIEQVVSVDGSTQYRVLTGMGDRGNAIVAVAAPLTAVDEAQNALIRTLVAVGALVMAAMLVIAWLVIRQGLLPLERIAHTADDIAGGDLSHRAGVRHDDTEVGRLGTAFDSMLDQIESAFGQQQRALEAVAHSEERLRRFAADASHELRTPLTAIRGYAELYRAGGLGDRGEMDQAMDRIGSESRRMTTLVEELLLLARLDQGRTVRFERVDLSRVVADAVADLRAVEPSRPVGIAIEERVVVNGDEDRLRQVVTNLVANVRVHTPPSTPLEVLLRADRPGGVAELRIVDHGPGIDPAIVGQVFDRFFRADPGRSRDRGGSGLGLSIVASIVHAHGGSLWHELTHGGGATFAVRLGLTGASQVAPGSPSGATG